MIHNILKWTIKHLYFVLLLLSGVIFTIAGFVFMRIKGEVYGQQEAMAGLAIHELKVALAPADEAEGYFELGEDIAIAEVEGEAFVDDEEEELEFEEEDSQGQIEEVEEAKQPETEVPQEDIEASETDISESEIKESDMEETDTGEAKEGEEPAEYKEKPEDKKDIEEEDKPKKEKKESSKKKKKKTKWKTVDEDYFKDALFIGDSRQQGFGLFSGIEDTTVYAQKSYVISKASTLPIVQTPIGKITLADALAIQQHKFKKIYIMFGLNEMGSYNADQVDQYYYNLIDYIKKMQPGATIYIESIIHVTAQKAQSTPIFDNAKIDERNEHLKNVAKNEKIVYLNLNNVLTDEDGNLFADAASDGVHLKGEYIQIWKEYLMEHVANIEESEEEYDYIELTDAQRIFKEQLDAYYANLYGASESDAQ